MGSLVTWLCLFGQTSYQILLIYHNLKEMPCFRQIQKSLAYIYIQWICQGVTSCVHERGRNQISPFWTQVMFSVFRGPKYDDIRPNHTKNIKKLLSGYFLAYPPKMHYSAPKCSAMYCSVNAWIIHSRWVKYDPQWPRMTDYSPGWHTRGQGGTRGSRGAPGGARGC